MRIGLGLKAHIFGPSYTPDVIFDVYFSALRSPQSYLRSSCAHVFTCALLRRPKRTSDNTYHHDPIVICLKPMMLTKMRKQRASYPYAAKNGVKVRRKRLSVGTTHVPGCIRSRDWDEKRLADFTNKRS